MDGCYKCQRIKARRLRQRGTVEALLDSLRRELAALRELITNQPCLHAKDMQMRYGNSEATLNRWLRFRAAPPPCPLHWRALAPG